MLFSFLKSANKNQYSRYFFLVAVILLVLGYEFLPAQADFNQQINYQGRLNDASGNPLADGDYHMRFKLCTDSSCAADVFDETWTTGDLVSLSDGLFSVLLGSVSSTALASVDFNQDLYLEVSVGGSGVSPSWETLLPRKRLGAVPNAFNSDRVDGFHASSTATAGYLPVLDSSAGLTISGVTSTGNLYVAGNATTTGVLYGGSGSYFGDTIGNYWRTEVWGSPVGNLAMLRGSSIDGTADIGAIWNGLYVVGDSDNNPVLLFVDNADFDLLATITYVTSSDALFFSGPTSGYVFNDGPLYNQADNPQLTFSDINGDVESDISFNTSTDAMVFSGASGGYSFNQGNFSINNGTLSLNNGDFGINNSYNLNINGGDLVFNSSDGVTSSSNISFDSDDSLNFNGASGGYNFNNGDLYFNSTLSDASDSHNFFTIAPDINQSGTAGYTAFDISVTENSLGSGQNYLAVMGLAGNGKFFVETDGDVRLTGNLTVGDSSSANIGVSDGNANVLQLQSAGVIINNNATTTGYLTVGSVPANAIFTAGNLNIQNNLYSGGYLDVLGYVSSSALQVNGNVTTTGYLTVGNAPSGANFTAGNLNIENNLVTGGDIIIASGQGLTLGGVYHTSWPSGGGDVAFWTTSTNGLVGSPTLGAGHAIVVGSSSYPAATTSNVSFEVVGNAKIGGDLEVTGTSTLATTSLAYDSWIGSALGTKSLQFKDYTVSNGSFVNGLNTNYLESNNDLTGVGVNDNFIVMGTADNSPSLIFSGEGGENVSIITYSTSSNYLLASLLNPLGDGIAYTGTLFNTDDLILQSDNSPTVSFGAISDGGESANISFGTTTDILSFVGATGGYEFDDDVTVASGMGITLGGVYRTSWPSVSASGDSFWQTSTDGLIGYPLLDAGYSIVIGSNVTTTNNVKLEVVGNTKLGGDLDLTGNMTSTNATTTGIAYMGTLGISSEYFTDLTGLGLTNYNNTLRVATSSLGLLTTDVAEGDYLYWTTTRFDNRLSATTSLPNLNVLTGLATIGSSLATTTFGGNLSVSGNSTLGTVISGIWNGSTVAVSRGGTGATTFTSNGILYGNGTSAIQATAAGTNNYLLYSNAGTPAWTNAPTISGANITSLNATNISTGILAVTSGGTGWSAISSGYLPFGNGTSALSTSSNLYWNNSTSRLSLGAGTSPSARLELRDASAAQLRAGYSSTIYLDLTVGSNDIATFNMVGNSGVNPDVIAFSDAIGAAAGTVSAPGISFSGDLNTGLYSISADTLGLTTGGTERLRITSGGHVLIGTVTDYGTLSVDGNINKPYSIYSQINYSSSSNIYAGYFDGTNSGSGSGYGIYGVADNYGGYFEATNSNGSGVTGVGYYGMLASSNDEAGSAIFLFNLNGAYGVNSVASKNYFSGDVGIGTLSDFDYRLSVKTSNNTDGFLKISSTTNSSVFIIDNNGNVGIGTSTDSSSRLTINGGFSVYDGSTNWGFKHHSDAAGSGMAFTASGDNLYFRPYNGGDVQFFNNINGSGDNSKILKIFGLVGIGTSTPEAVLHVASTSASIYIDAEANTNPNLEFREGNVRKWHLYNDNSNDRLYIVDDDNNSGVYLAQDATSWTANSDIRLKENLQPIEGALEKILGLNAYIYNFIGTDRREIGLIAQEVQPNFPELVDTSAEYWGISYDRVGPILVAAIKEQQAQINDLAISLNSTYSALTVNDMPVSDSDFYNLSVRQAATFYGTITVKGVAEFESKVVFKDHIYLDKDSAGVAKILAGTTSAQVVFAKPYEVAPIVNLTPKTNLAGLTWWVETEATSSFVVAISQPLDHDIEINWQAIAVLADANSGIADPTIVEITPLDETNDSLLPNDLASGADTDFDEADGVDDSIDTLPIAPLADAPIDNSSQDDNINNSNPDSDTITGNNDPTTNDSVSEINPEITVEEPIVAPPAGE